MNAVSPVETLVTDHLDLWTAALKRKSTAGRGSSSKVELYGIKKLRELILELAIRGLLVPQDPNDEPASELLKKIAVEKARLVKEGKIKKDKPQLPIAEEEKPFNIPAGWKLIRFGDLLINRDSERIPLSVDERATRRGEYDYYGASGIIDSIDAYLFDKPLLLIGEDGANLINRSTPIAFMAYGKYWVNNHAHVLDGYSEGLLLYACLYINAISLEPYVTGTAQPKMNQAKMNGIVVAIPPLSEQHRIVAKVDELMALCDQLEQETEASLGAHQTLVETLLSALTSAADHTQFASAWQRIAGHFDTLFTTEESIAQLKQTILQLAVMGKLVPQDPNDEPASELLKKIAAEKAKLVKEGKIKKGKPQPPIAEEEKPFELTTGWEWVKLNDMLPEFQNGASSRGDKGGIPTIVLRLADIKYRRVSVADTRALPIKKDDVSKYGLAQGDILIVRVNGSSDIVGQFIPVEAELQAIYCDHFIRMRINQEWCHTSYLCLVGQTKLIRDRISSLFITTAGQKTVNQGHIGSLLVALPPLAEQHRIVAKVDELIALCDQLKSRLADAQTTQLHLADALVERAIG